MRIGDQNMIYRSYANAGGFLNSALEVAAARETMYDGKQQRNVVLMAQQASKQRREFVVYGRKLIGSELSTDLSVVELPPQIEKPELTESDS